MGFTSDTHNATETNMNNIGRDNMTSSNDSRGMDTIASDRPVDCNEVSLDTAGDNFTSDNPTSGNSTTGNTISDTSTSEDSNVTSSTARRVFATPELLENILLHLPMLDLLLAQRVDKTFQGAINSSIHLRRALFFETRPQTWSEKDLNTPPSLNPLLRKMFPDNMASDTIDYTGKLDCTREHVLDKQRGRDIGDFETPRECMPIIFDGHFCKTKTGRYDAMKVDIEEKQWYLHLPALDGDPTVILDQSSPISKAQLCVEASWHKMYPASAPLKIHECLVGTKLPTRFGGVLHYKEVAWKDMGHIMPTLDYRHGRILRLLL